MLVQIDARNCVNTDEMKRVWRNGNYTDIIMKDGSNLQIWDEDEELWCRITNAIKEKK